METSDIEHPTSNTQHRTSRQVDGLVNSGEEKLATLPGIEPGLPP